MYLTVIHYMTWVCSADEWKIHLKCAWSSSQRNEPSFNMDHIDHITVPGKFSTWFGESISFFKSHLLLQQEGKWFTVWFGSCKLIWYWVNSLILHSCKVVTASWQYKKIQRNSHEIKLQKGIKTNNYLEIY